MMPPGQGCSCLLFEDDPDGPRIISRIQYDAAKRAFRIPLLLPPNKKVAFTLTKFLSADGVAANPVKLQYQVSGEEFAEADREKTEAGAREPHLLELLGTMKQERRQITSIAERVQTLMLQQRNGLFFDCLLYTSETSHSAGVKKSLMGVSLSPGPIIWEEYLA